MNEADIFQILSKIFERPITIESEPVPLHEVHWDSLSQLSLIASLDSFGLSLSAREIEDVKTIGDLVETMKKLRS